MAGTGGKAAGKRAKRSESAGTPEPNSDRSGGAQPLIDLDLVRGLIEAVDGSGIDSLEISRAGTRIRVSKTAPVSITQAPAQPVQPTAPSPLAAAAPSAGGSAAAPDVTPGAAAGGGPAAAVEELYEVTSPMVGTFYRAPAPDAPPYVEVGSTVSKGQTLCILEAMKLMNELESEVEGVVREVLVQTAEPVEYGQTLFKIQLTGK